MGKAVTKESGAEAEGAVTFRAGVRPLAAVGAEVLDTGGAVGKALATLRAQVRLLTGVDPQVLHQVGAPGKLLSTHVTAEGFGSQVTALVAQQAAAQHEPFAAVGARVWLVLGLGPVRSCWSCLRRLPAGNRGPGELLPSVCPLVLYSGGAVTEALATDAALVGLLSRVRPLVFHQVRALTEALATFTTNSGALTGRNPRSRHLGRTWGCRPDPIGLLTSVSSLVFDSGRAIPKALATDPTLVGLLPCVSPLVFHQIGHLPEALAALATHRSSVITALPPAGFSQDLGDWVSRLALCKPFSVEP